MDFSKLPSLLDWEFAPHGVMNGELEHYGHDESRIRTLRG